MSPTRPVYVVKPSGRPWSTWLGLPSDAVVRAPDDFLKQNRSQRTLTGLVLIHGSNETSRSEDADLYRALHGLADDLWLLYYSGSGYQHARPSDLPPRIHHLVYPIENQLSEVHQLCFRRFLSRLTEPDRVKDDPWKALYPPDNVSAVALMCLLANATDRRMEAALVGMKDDLPRSPIRDAYLEYCSASALFGSGEPWPYKVWQNSLKERRYVELEQEMRRVLGQAPD